MVRDQRLGVRGHRSGVRVRGLGSGVRDQGQQLGLGSQIGVGSQSKGRSWDQGHRLREKVTSQGKGRGHRSTVRLQVVKGHE